MSRSTHDDDADEAGGPVPARRTSPVVVILLGANLALTGLVAWRTLAAGPATAQAAPVGAAAGPIASDSPRREVTGPIVPLESFVVNLDEPDSARYLKVTMQAELAGRSAAKVFDKSKQLIRDEVLRYLSGLTVADTLGPENKDRIREELQAAVADVIGPGLLHRVIFAEFVVQ